MDLSDSECWIFQESFYDNLTGKMLNIEHFFVISMPCFYFKPPVVTCVLSYCEPSLIGINGATSELAS